MAVLNWCYGAKTPDVIEAVDEQLRLAHQYRNRLCELELHKRERYYDVLRELAPEFVAAEEALNATKETLESLRITIQKVKVKQRTKKPNGIDAELEQVKELKAARKDQAAVLKAAKKKAMEDQAVIDALAENNEQHKAAMKLARKDSGLYWPTAGYVDTTCRSFGAGTPPRFARWTGEGQIAMQLQGGMPVDEAVTENTKCYFSGTGRKRLCHFRIGSDGRDPVFAAIPVVFHRDLPNGGKIKWAYLERRKMADRNKWQLRLTIDVPAAEVDVDESKWCAFHFGWSKTSIGLRVATWTDSDGATKHVTLSNDHLDDVDRLAHIDRYRDTLLQDAIALIKEHEPVEAGWWAEAASHVHQWRSPRRLTHLLSEMELHEFDGQSAVWPTTPVEVSRRISPRKKDTLGVKARLAEHGFSVRQTGNHPDYLEATRSGESFLIRCSNHTAYMPSQLKYATLSDAEHVDLFVGALDGREQTLRDTLTRMVGVDRMLWRHQARLSKRISRRRKDIYRNVAAEAARTSDVMFYSAPQVAKLTQNAKPEDLSEDERKVHQQARIASVSQLTELLVDKFPTRAVCVDSVNLTLQCSGCGELLTVDDRICHCSSCDLTIDHEQNALANTIARGHVMLQSGALLALQEKEEKRKSDAAERLIKMQAGRRKKLDESQPSQTEGQV